MRNLAVLADIHGVLPALDAALAEIAAVGAEHVVVCGDTVAGPQPVEVLDRLLALGDTVTLVRGNADREVLALVDDPALRPAVPIDAWAADRLRTRPDLVSIVRALPHPVTLEVDGFGPVLCCHGTPRDDVEVVLVDTRLSRWDEAFADVPPEVRTVVCGHTHMPFVRLVDTRLVLNPGSVGMPYGGAGAHWALLADGAVTLRTARFDIEAARAQVAAGCAFPDVDAWTDEYLHSRSSDADALTAFAPRDGR